MKALTIRQPWASLVVVGAKMIETRSWATRHRGLVLIHAGKRLYTAADKHADLRLFFAAHDALAMERNGGVYLLPYGEVVAVAQLVYCVPVESITWTNEINGWQHLYRGPTGDSDDGNVWLVSHDQRPLGDFAPGRWAWLLDDVRPLAEPVPARGRQGLWDIDLSVAGVHG